VDDWGPVERKVFECVLPQWLSRCSILSKRAKKSEGLEQHKKLQREKDQKKKARKQVALPAKHAKKK
jgi:hypothetical protein